MAQNAHSSLGLGYYSTSLHSERLVIDVSGAPIHKRDSMLGLVGGNGGFDIFRNHITMVEKAASDAFYQGKDHISQPG